MKVTGLRVELKKDDNITISLPNGKELAIDSEGMWYSDAADEFHYKFLQHGVFEAAEE